MSNPVGVIAPGYFPSYHCVKDAGILDAGVVKKIDQTIAHDREAGIIGGGADMLLAGQSLDALKGIGKKLAIHLKSQKFNNGAGIRTVGELAKYEGGFGARLQELTKSQQALLESLRAALNTCKAPGAVTGPKVSVTENDPRMDARMTPGRETMGYSNGKAGYAELTLIHDPSNNGIVMSNLTVAFSPFSAPGRGGPREHEGFSVTVGASGSALATANRLKAELEDRGLACDVTPIPDQMVGIPQHQVRVQIWSPRVVD